MGLNCQKPAKLAHPPGKHIATYPHDQLYLRLMDDRRHPPHLPTPDPEIPIEKIEIQPYRLPLRQPWQSARGIREERRGWLVGLEAAGMRGYGDCAPLPEAGTEDEAQALAALRDWQAAALGQPLGALLQDFREAGVKAPWAPAARYSIECALLDLAARSAGIPLRRWLNPQAADAVPVNATLGALRDQTPAQVAACCQAGFRVLKLKVGLEAPRVEIGRLEALVPALGPGAWFRLDANGAWDLDQATAMVETLNRLPIESLEEPLREPSARELAALQAQARFAIALDESLHPARAAPVPAGLAAIPGHHAGILNGDVQSVDGRLMVRRLVLKPAVVGGIWRTLVLAREAARLGVEVVLTSLIESAAGLWPSLQLAAAIGSPLAQGLATSSWLRQDLGHPPSPRRGSIWLGSDPGSGFQPW